MRNRQLTIAVVGVLTLAYVAIATTAYRFRHPGMTETELFLAIPEAVSSPFR